MMPTNNFNSREFPAPFVRIRGRFSQDGRIKWSPCVRSFKGPATNRRITMTEVSGNNNQSNLEQTKSADGDDPIRSTSASVPDAESAYNLAFEDKEGRILEKSAVKPVFYDFDSQWATFVQRMPYNKKTERVVLRYGKRELGVLKVTMKLPEFELVYPREATQIDPNGILHIKWKTNSSHKQKEEDDI